MQYFSLTYALHPICTEETPTGKESAHQVQLQQKNNPRYAILYNMTMRRTDRQQSEDFGRKVLQSASYGVLSLVDKSGEPYAIPLSFALADQTIYLHSATEGEKLRILAANPQAVFTCVGKTRVLPDKFSTEYESAIVSGLAHVVTDHAQKRAGLLALAQKYSPQYHKEAESYIERMIDKTTVIALTIQKITAKARLPKKESHL
jgi:nitroimidazol reductase NimA-like FMN-containing flavoprotein (pyridoxamine 5'-phosphate oxidase superfamily)